LRPLLVSPSRAKLLPGGIGAVFALAVALTATSSRAADMDPTPERLVLQRPNVPAGETCQSIAANPEAAFKAGPNAKPSDFSCLPDNAAFRNMVSELGFAVAPTAFHPARTTGIGGFALTLEASFTKINADDFSQAENGSAKNPATRQYWHDGTQGAQDANTKVFARRNDAPDSLIQVYSLKARKGLPFGLELAGALGYVANTTMWVGGADVRWSLLEGFRTGVLGILPDLAVGGGVRTVTGTSKFHLTVVGIDAQLSKPVPIGDFSTITPYVGYQRLIIFGDSLVVDSTPNVDPAEQCGYAGTDPNGAPICRHRLSNGLPNNADYNNNFAFDKVRVHRHRGIFGVSYRYEILYLASQFLIDLTPPNDENPGLSSSRQWTMSFEAGVFF
jgi:hypothetical protein